MKNLLLLLFLCSGLALTGQPLRTALMPTAETIPAYPLTVSVGKTTNLVFQYEVKSVDRGSKALLVQKVKGTGNILQIKASTSEFPETNLSVVTADNQLHSFLVMYDTAGSVLNYRFTDGTSANRSLMNFATDANILTDAQIEDNLQVIAGSLPYLKKPGDSRFGIYMNVSGIYIAKNILFVSLRLRNNTPIDYDIESLILFIKDKKQSKSTATQSVQLPWLMCYGDSAHINGFSSQQLVVAFPKFTIPDKKDCVMQMREKEGGRHLEFKISNKQLIRSHSL